MKIIKRPDGESQNQYFTGNVKLAKPLESEDGDPIKLYRVKFSAEARTDWHTHEGIQILYVLSGECRLQTEGEDFQDIPSGTTVIIQPGEKHWHGASPKGDMVHLAYGDYLKTDWMEAVADEDYFGEDKS